MKGTMGYLPACCCENCLLGLGSYNNITAFLVLKLVSLFIQLIRGIGNLSVKQDFLRKFAKKCLSRLWHFISGLTLWYNSFSATFACDNFPFWTFFLGEHVAFGISLFSEMYVHSKEFKSSIAKKKKETIAPYTGPVVDSIKHFKQLPS